jgi:hypothetical protein
VELIVIAESNKSLDCAKLANSKFVKVDMSPLARFIVVQNPQFITEMTFASNNERTTFFENNNPREFKRLQSMKVIYQDNVSLLDRNVLFLLAWEEVIFHIDANRYNNNTLIIPRCLELCEKTKVRRFIFEVNSTYDYHLSNVICHILHKKLDELEIVMKFAQEMEVIEATPAESLETFRDRLEYWVLKSYYA